MFSCNYKWRATLPCIYDCHLTLLRKPSSLINEWLPASTTSRIHPRILLYLHAALQPIVSYNQTLIDTYRRYFNLLKYSQLFKSQLESWADLIDLWTCIRSQDNTSVITRSSGPFIFSKRKRLAELAHEYCFISLISGGIILIFLFSLKPEHCHIMAFVKTYLYKYFTAVIDEHISTLMWQLYFDVKYGE